MGKKSKSANKKRGTAATSELVIDLHRLTRDEAAESLEQILDRALLQGCSRIKVIHGIGSGVVKRAVHDYLSQARHVSEYKADPLNPGVTWVLL